MASLPSPPTPDNAAAGFHSCPHTTEPALVQSASSGAASSIDVLFQYEVETSSASLAAAIERVQASMLERLAERSGLLACAGTVHPWRRLRAGGRGSSSLVGLGSSPVDEVLTLPCRADEAAAEGAAAEPFAGEKETMGGMAGSVAMEEFQHEGGAGQGSDTSGSESAVVGGADGAESAATGADTILEASASEEALPGGLTDNIILAATRIDGKMTIEKSIHRVTNPNQGWGNAADEEGTAFNYVSTQSLPKEQSSHSAHNPLTPPAVFQQNVRTNGGPIETPSGTIQHVPQSSEDPSSSTHMQPTNTRQCTVIQGKMTAYSSNSKVDPFENIEGRLLAALEEELMNNQGAFTDDLVLAVRMYDPSDSGTAVETSTGYVTAIKDGTQEAEAGFTFTGPMAILVSLLGALLVLVALFVKTGRPKRKENDVIMKAPSSPGETYHDDEVEPDFEVERKLTTVRSSDDYSVGEFSVSSATNTSNPVSPARRILSWGRRRNRGVEAEREDVLEDLEVESATRHWEREPSATVAGSGVVPIQSSMFGLVATRPRAASPNSEVELEVQSVYDCDASCTKDNDAHAENLVARNVHAPMPDPNAAKEASRKAEEKKAVAKKGLLGGLFVKKARGTTPAIEYQAEWGKAPVQTFTYDEDDKPRAAPVVTNALAVKNDEIASVATPDIAPGCMEVFSCTNNANGNTLLQFFSARERSANSRSEVEASLKPFNKEPPIKEIQPEYFVGKPASVGDDHILLSDRVQGDIGMAQGGHGKTRLVRKFGKMLKQRPRAHSRGGSMGSIDIQEIHQVYSYPENDETNAAEASPKPSPRTAPLSVRTGEPYPVYTKPPASPLRRPLGFYKSPSEVTGKRSRSRVGGLAQEDALRKENVANDVPADQLVTKTEDSESVAVVDTPMCGIQDDCAAWWPEFWR